jgi:hypothetical protein
VYKQSRPTKKRKRKKEIRHSYDQAKKERRCGRFVGWPSQTTCKVNTKKGGMYAYLDRYIDR